MAKSGVQGPTSFAPSHPRFSTSALPIEKQRPWGKLCTNASSKMYVCQSSRLLSAYGSTGILSWHQICRRCFCASDCRYLVADAMTCRYLSKLLMNGNELGKDCRKPSNCSACMDASHLCDSLDRDVLFAT